MGFFAQAYEVLNGNQATCKPENDIDRDQAPQLQPGKGCAVNTKPHRLPDNDIRLGRRAAWEATMEKIDDGQQGAGNRSNQQNEESPSKPDERQSQVDDSEQPTPPRNE